MGSRQTGRRKRREIDTSLRPIHYEHSCSEGGRFFREFPDNEFLNKNYCAKWLKEVDLARAACNYFTRKLKQDAGPRAHVLEISVSSPSYGKLNKFCEELTRSVEKAGFKMRLQNYRKKLNSKHILSYKRTVEVVNPNSSFISRLSHLIARQNKAIKAEMKLKKTYAHARTKGKSRREKKEKKH